MEEIAIFCIGFVWGDVEKVLGKKGKRQPEIGDGFLK